MPGFTLPWDMPCNMLAGASKLQSTQFQIFITQSVALSALNIFELLRHGPSYTRGPPKLCWASL